jgi:hypothetical protein
MNVEAPMRDQGQAWLAVATIVALGVLAWLRPMPPQIVPARIPATQAEAWMADCLPGVGSKTRERMAEALRNGDTGRLPPQARSLVQELFSEATDR